MGLLRLIKEDANARRVFGRREIKIIEKQLLGVNLTQSEKNRLSRDIRKKLEFISKISGFENEFKIKKGAEIKKITNETKEIILEDELNIKIQKIVLYGSAVENKLSLSSDLDLAVVFDKIAVAEATLFRKRISGKVNEKIDIQVYNHLPDKLKKEIDEKGKIIYSK